MHVTEGLNFLNCLLEIITDCSIKVFQSKVWQFIVLPLVMLTCSTVRHLHNTHKHILPSNVQKWRKEGEGLERRGRRRGKFQPQSLSCIRPWKLDLSKVKIRKKLKLVYRLNHNCEWCSCSLKKYSKSLKYKPTYQPSLSLDVFLKQGPRWVLKVSKIEIL